MSEHEGFGARVRRLRAGLAITQEELAKRLGVRQSTLSRWETKEPPRGPALVKLANELGTTAGYLISGEDETEEQVDTLLGLLRALKEQAPRLTPERARRIAERAPDIYRAIEDLYGVDLASLPATEAETVLEDLRDRLREILRQRQAVR